MGIFDKLFAELIDIIEWTDDTSNTLVYRFPRYGNEIKNGAMLTVREGQIAVLVNEGEVADVYEPGLYKLETANMPILSTLQGWKYGFESPFKAEVYFFNTTQFTDMRWGLRNPLIMRDSEFGVVRLRAFGTYAFKISDVKTLLTEIVGTDGHFTVEEISDQLRNLMVSGFANIVAESKISILDLAGNYDKLGGIMTEYLDPEFNSFGLTLTKFLIENISLPEAVEKALDERSSMGAVGDLDKFTKFQAAQSMRDAAQNPGGGAGAGIGMGMGFAMAQSFGEALSNQNKQKQNQDVPPPVPEIEHFYIVSDGQRAGPFNLAAIAEYIKKGDITADTLVWKSGMADWQAASEVRSIASMLNSEPPPIPKS
ncbi:MAG: SPFH domain-containing protein [Xanthomonadales bacterium]|nr:SPFH domain-containing protein [Xanthomonadales bacterium]